MPRDRFVWCPFTLAPGETQLFAINHTSLYDGDQKSRFTDGLLTLTSHRILWTDTRDNSQTIGLSLEKVFQTSVEGGSLFKSPKLSLVLSGRDDQQQPGPNAYSAYNYVMVSSKADFDGFCKALQLALAKREWEKRAPVHVAAVQSPKRTAAGLGRIEANLHQKHTDASDSINQAFEDLNILMAKAKDMVALSKKITESLKTKQGVLTDDETVQLRSYLMSLGIDDPVTRDQHAREDQYFKELARQIAQITVEPLKQAGGMMTLQDVYCLVNRSRGFELISPDDLLGACAALGQLSLAVRPRLFDDTGLRVLQLDSLDDGQLIDDTTARVVSCGSLSAIQLASLCRISVILARERLLYAERVGRLCRDDSVHGLCFFPNRFFDEM